MKKWDGDRFMDAFAGLHLLQIALYPIALLLLIWAANSRFF